MDELRKEAERLRRLTEQQAAGRVCEQSREERDAAYKNIERYYNEKKEFDAIINAGIPAKYRRTTPPPKKWTFAPFL
jgi:hypothetical protein